MKDLELLRKILSVQSESYKTVEMVEVIKNIAEQFGAWTTIEDGNLYAVKGTEDPSGYPCIVSHTDTVHKIIPYEHYRVMQFDDYLMGFNIDKKAPTGIGGDDKVGIYIALSMIKNLDRVKAVFFKDEEVGCKGSGVAKMEFFDDVRFVLQCDRRGNGDFVNKIGRNEIQTKEFMEAVTPIISDHNYKFHDGGMTDVEQLFTRGLKVSSANMSCGYYNPHSEEEIVCISDVFNCEEMVYRLLSELTDTYAAPVYTPYVAPTYTPPSYGKAYGGYRGGYYGGYSGTLYDEYDYWGNQIKDDKKSKTYSQAWKDDKDYTDTLNELDIKECWSCGITYNKMDIDNYGLCRSCNQHHAGEIGVEIIK